MRPMSNAESSPPPVPLPTLPIPLHAVSRDGAGNELSVKRRPGRPRSVRRAPSATEESFIHAIRCARDLFIDSDPLVGALRDRVNVDLVLREVLNGLATESASILWEIRRGREAGRDTAQLSSRRIDALSKIGLVELARVKLSLGVDLTPSDPRTSVIVNVFVDSVRRVLEVTLPAATFSLVMSEIEQRLHEWRQGPQPGR